jgi:hypothetical protein
MPLMERYSGYLLARTKLVQNSNMERNHKQSNTKMTFGSFKTSYGQNRTWDADRVSVTPERTIGISTKPANSNEDYKNVRDLK